jgi:hypothetical protein
MNALKTSIRLLVTLFAALFGTLQLSMTIQALLPADAWVRQMCHAHPIVSPGLSFVTLFAITLLVLSRRCAAWRLPLAVVVLASYGIYEIVEAVHYRAWSLALAPLVALGSAVGVGLRASWGAFLTCALSTFFVVYWIWGVVTAARNGTFVSRSALIDVLMLVPGTAFLLLAGFCCYVSFRASRLQPVPGPDMGGAL